MDTYEIERKQRKSKNASIGHVKRCLLKKEPLTGKTLELALSFVDAEGDDDFSQFLRKIGEKMKAGQPLDDYELHIMVDMILLQAKICS